MANTGLRLFDAYLYFEGSTEVGMGGQRRRLIVPLEDSSTGLPLSSVSVYILRPGAQILSGSYSWTSLNDSQTVVVTNPGTIKSGDKLYFWDESADSLNTSNPLTVTANPSVNGSNWEIALQLQQTPSGGGISAAAESDRLILAYDVVADAVAKHYTHDVGGTAATSLIATGTDGILQRYTDLDNVDLLCIKSNYDTVVYPDVPSFGLTDKVRPEDFGAVGDGSTDDLVPIQKAFDHAASVSTAYVQFSNKTYSVSGTITAKACPVFWNNTTISCSAATGADDNIIEAGAINFRWYGHLRLTHANHSATSGVYGIVLSSTASAYIQSLELDLLARGIELAGVTDVQIGDIMSVTVDGEEQGGSTATGSVVYMTAGCTQVQIGKIDARGFDGDCVYIHGTTAPNIGISIGEIVAYASTSSTVAKALRVRAATELTVGSVVADDGQYGVFIQQENGDTAGILKNVNIGSIVARDQDAASGVGVWIGSADASARPSRINVDSIVVENPQQYGLVTNNVDELTVGSVNVEGNDGASGLDGVYLSDTHYSTIGRVVSKNAGVNNVRLDECTGVVIDTVIGQDPSIQSAGYPLLIDTDCLDCRVNTVVGSTPGSGSYAYVAYINAPKAVGSVNHVIDEDGSASTSKLRFNAVDFVGMENGRLIHSAVPAAGTWVAGDIVYNSAPTTSVGWVCTTAGSPGTWFSFGPIAGRLKTEQIASQATIDVDGDTDLVDLTGTTNVTIINIDGAAPAIARRLAIVASNASGCTLVNSGVGVAGGVITDTGANIAIGREERVDLISHNFGGTWCWTASQ